MHTPNSVQVQNRIRDLLDVYHAAMVDADTTTLSHLLEPAFVLVHLTGYRQLREEWFDVIDTGAFDYHDIRINPPGPDIALAADACSAVVEGYGVFNATINGTPTPWRLQFTLRLALQQDRWRIAEGIYRVC